MTTGYYVGDVDISSIFKLNSSATFADTTGILLTDNTDLNLYFEPYPIGSGEPYASETGYISKTGNDISTIFRKIPPHTFTSASIYATSAASGGTINNAALQQCQGICIDPDSNIYFCNSSASAKSIYKINTITNTPYSSFVAATATLAGHVHICIDKINNLHTVGYTTLTVTQITPAGMVSTLISTGISGVGIAIDNSYNIFTCHARVIMYKYNGTGYNAPVYIAYAASGGTAYTSATNATPAINLLSPGNVNGLCINNGKLYISCLQGYVFYINLANVYANTTVLITKVAGTGSNSSPAQQDGVNVSSLTNIINTPYGMNFDKEGNIYICCTTGKRIVKVTPNFLMTTFIGPVAGAVIVVPTLNNPFHACFNKTYDTMYFTCNIGSNAGLVYKVI